MNSLSPITINDLILEILSRLPSKSVARFGCVSKQWASMFGSPYFKELFRTRSSAMPRLLFAVVENGYVNAQPKGCGVWSFFSLPQLEHPYDKSSSIKTKKRKTKKRKTKKRKKSSSTTLKAAAEFHVKFSPKGLRINHSYDLRYCSCGYASGLFYIHGNRYQARPLVCNPVTGRYAITPDRYTYRKAYSFFGFDPIDNQYKALSMAYPSGPGHHKILTFEEDGDLRWRKIKCPLRYEFKSDGVCINGVLYYLADTSDWEEMNEYEHMYVIVCFDVRSEKFSFIDVERFCRLINYKGKLAVVFWEDDEDIYEICFYGKNLDKYLEDNLDVDATNELHVWVLEDFEKEEWSEYAYTWTDDKFFRRHLSIAGVTASGEIVFSMRKYISNQPFYVFYFNPARNTLQRVEIQGFGKAFKQPCSVRTFVNHVEDLDVNNLELLKSFHPPLKETGYVEPSDSESDNEGEEENREDHLS